MPLPAPARLEEYARKGVELLLRRLAVAPEQRTARRLRDTAAPQDGRDGRPRVLIVSPRDWAAHVQYESVIAHALRRRGAHVEFLTCGGGLEVCDRANTYEAPPMPCTSCRRYVEGSVAAHGFPMRTIRDGWSGNDPGEWPELDRVGAANLAAVEADGLALGQAVDIPLKWFLCAAALEDDPLAGLTGRAFLRSARRIAQGVRRAISEVQPDVVLLLNGLFLFEGVTWAICRQDGIDVVTYERAFLKETLVFHRGIPAGFYDFTAEWPDADRALTPAEEAELDGYLSRRRRGDAFDQFWTFRDQAVERRGGRLVTLFTNLTWDTAVLGRDLAFPSIRAWLDTVVDAFARRPDHSLIIRVHPSEQRLPGKRTRDSLEAYIRRRYPALPPNVAVVGADDLTSSYPLMEASDFGLVYTSTTGLELALSGTPVVVCGDVHYRGKGFTVDVSSPDGFLAALDRLLADPVAGRPDVGRARRYAHFFFFRAPVPAPYVVEPLPGLARITTDRADDLDPGRNEALDRICDGILNGTSFVGV